MKHITENRGVQSYTKTRNAEKVEALIKSHFEGVNLFWKEWDALEPSSVSWFDCDWSFELTVSTVSDKDQGARVMTTLEDVSDAYHSTERLAVRTHWTHAG